MLARKVFVASAVLSGSRLLARILDMVAAIVIARFLTPADFGMVAIATAALILARAVTDLQVTEAMIRLQDFNDRIINTAFTLSVVRGLIIAAIMCSSAWPMAYFYNDQRLVDLMWVLAIAPVAQGLISPKMVHFLKEVDYTPTSIMETVAKLIAFALSLVVAYHSQSYWALAIALVVPPLISTPLSYFYAPYRPRFDLSETKPIFAFAGWIMLAEFVSVASNSADRLFIGGILGKAQVGAYAMGRQMASTISWGLGAPMMQVLFPGFSKLQTDIPRLTSAYLRGQAMIVAVLLPLGFGLALVASPFVAAVLGPQWQPVVPVLVIFAPVVATTAAFTMPTRSLILSLGKPKVLLVRDLIIFGIGIPSVIAGAIWFGLMGAVIARCLACVLHIVLNLQIVRRELGIPAWRQLANCGRTGISVAAMVGTTTWFGSLGVPSLGSDNGILVLAATSVVGAAAYISTHIATWLVAGQPEGPENFARHLIKFAHLR